MGFKVSSRFREAAQVINGVPADKFSLFLTRIIQKLHLKNTELFSDAEKDQLKSLFGLTSESLEVIQLASKFIFEEAAFTNTGPEPLYEILLEAGFDEQHGKVVGRLWATEAPGYISKLKERTLGYKTLLSSRHHLNLRMSDSAEAKQQDPTAIFELSVGSNEFSSSGEILKEVTTLEFSHSELSSFFTQLDLIQQQLDALNPS